MIKKYDMILSTQERTIFYYNIYIKSVEIHYKT